MNAENWYLPPSKIAENYFIDDPYYCKGTKMIGTPQTEIYKDFLLIYFEFQTPNMSKNMKAYRGIVTDLSGCDKFYSMGNVIDLDKSPYNTNTIKDSFKGYLQHLLNRLTQ